MGVPLEQSIAEWLADQSEQDQLEFIQSLSPALIGQLRYSWGFWARHKQIPPTDPWDVWLVNAGRGFGKTRTGAEVVISWAREHPDTIIHLVGRTPGDARDVMIEGPGGILKHSPPDFRPLHEPSKSRLLWPNGSYALVFSSAVPEDLRGPQAHKAWTDEPATWIKRQETWDMLQFGCRLFRFEGDRPQTVVTTTPKNNDLMQYLIGLAEDLMEWEGTLDPQRAAERQYKRGGSVKKPELLVRMTKGSTFENRSNLAETFFTNIVAKYLHTRLGAQELFAETLADNPNALWKRARIDQLRVESVPEIRRVVIGVDPSGSTGENANECGIVAVGLGEDSDLYVMADASGIGTPAEWAGTVIELFLQARADAIVAERNFGGLMVEEVIRSAAAKRGIACPPIVMVQASRGKAIRAEPVALLYEQEPGHVHHCGMFLELEDEMCLAPWTLVLTDRGWIPVCTVRAGFDRVLTRDGWHRVLWAGQTGTADKIVSIDRLIVTPGHPIWTRDGWLRADQIKSGDEVIRWENGRIDQKRRKRYGLPGSQRTKTSWSTVGSVTSGTSRDITWRAATRPKGTRSMEPFIETSGPRFMGPFLRANSSITSMETGETIRSMAPTLPVSHEGNISLITRNSSNRVASPSCLLPSDERLLSEVGRTESPGSREMPLDALPVWNLQVEDCPEFFADGVLVHNCVWTPTDKKSPNRLDALVWAVHYLGLHAPVYGQTYGIF